MKKVILFLVSIIAIAFACKKNELPPVNPFAQNADSSKTNTSTFTNNPFQKIHQEIFKPKCANPGCHDGSFEPDFRTIESSYATLVNHKNIKKTLDGKFSLRAIPFNVDSSWLYYRITTTDGQLGRMPLYSPVLNEEHTNLIRTWIADGCKNQFNEAAINPNGFPQFSWYVASDSVVFNRVDTNRSIANQSNSPFLTKKNRTLSIIAHITDDGLPIDVTNLKLKISTTANNFISPNVIQTINGNYNAAFWQRMYFFNINTNSLPANKVLYFRIYCDNAPGVTNVEYPYDGMYSWWKDFCSFKVLP